MKKNSKKTQIPAYEFGLSGYGGMGGSFIKDQTTAGALGGAVSGATTGMAFGPIGAAAGAVIGGVAGGVMANKNKQQQRQMMASQMAAQQAANAESMSALLSQEWYAQNPIGNTYEYGGTSGSQMSWVNGGEIVQYPDGETKKVQSKSGATDDVLTSLPYGTNVFGGLPMADDKTFSEYANKVHTNNKKAQKDGGKYASKSLELNNRHLQELAKIQEMEKAKKNIKGKYKGMPAYKDGAMIRPSMEDYNRLIDDRANNYMYNLPFPAKPMIAPEAVTSNVIQTTQNLKASLPVNTNITGGGKINNDSLYNNLSRMASLAPVAYNFAQYAKGPSTVTPVENPYAPATINTMAQRRFNNRALIDANRRSTAIANYNANQITGTGQNMAYRAANEVNSRSQLYDVISQTNNINNQYLSDYAQTLNNLGQQSVSARNLAQDLNMRNQAKNRQFAATGVSQLSQFVQNWNRDRNLGKIQQGTWDVYAPYIQSAYTPDQYNQIYNRFF